MTDSPARTDPTPAALAERSAPVAHWLVEAFVSPNSRRAYAGDLHGLDAWLAGRRLEDAMLAGYLAEFHEQGRAPSGASAAVAAARFRVPARWRAQPGRGTDGRGAGGLATLAAANVDATRAPS